MYLKCLSGDKTDMEKRQLELEEPSDDDGSQSGGEASSEEAVIIKETTSDKKKKKKRSKVDSVGTPTKIIKYDQEVKAEKQQASNLRNKKCSMHGSKVGGSFLKCHQLLCLSHVCNYSKAIGMISHCFCLASHLNFWKF